MTEFLKWEELPITDNFIFTKVMQDKELCKGLLETILKIDIDWLGDPVTEFTSSESPDSKHVRFDVHIKNDSSTFIIEMQIVNTRELPLRARFYQAISDVADLKTGEKYFTLPENIVIFLCPFDLYESGFPIYTFENTCNEDNEIKMGDKTKKIFINFNFYAKIKDEETKRIMKFFSSGEVEGELSGKFQTALKQARKNLVWKREWMEINFALWDAKKLAEEKGYANGMEAGIAKGLEDGMAKGMEAGMAEGRKAAKAEAQVIIDRQTKENEILRKLLAKNGIEIPEEFR